MTEGEELLLDLLASSSNSLPVALKRLLQCAMVNYSSPPNTASPACSQCTAQGKLHPIVSTITFMHSQQSTQPQVCCQICCTGDQHRNSSQNQPSFSPEPQSATWTTDAAAETSLREEGGGENFDSPLLLRGENSDEQSWDHSQREGRGGGGEGGGAGGGLKGDWRAEEVEMEETEQKELEKIERDKKEEEEEEGMKNINKSELERMEECEESAEMMLVSEGRQMCSTHHKWMKSILLECSEEPLSQGALASLTPPLQSDTPALFSQVGRKESLSHEVPVSLPTLSSTPGEAARSGGSPGLGGASPMCVLRISAETQRLLIQSPLLQPFVLLTRLPPQHRAARGEEESGSQSEEWEEEEELEAEEEEEEDGESVSFDVNSLFSDSSQESESDNSDSDYVP